ncbi:MAG: MlaE family lipid ABC transporter permease subunit [Aquisalimonadaceae bacterium]
MSPTRLQPAQLIRDHTHGLLHCSGDWTLAGIDGRERTLSVRLGDDTPSQLDASGIERMDTAGALLLQQIRDRLGKDAVVEGLSDQHRALLEFVAQHVHETTASLPRKRDPLTALGVRTGELLREMLAFLDFIGRFTMDAVPRLLRPRRLRWKQVVGEIQHAGINALPILGMLAFLTGVVIAYQGGTPLRQYGANIFIVDLLTITMLREMAPLMTAIIVAGRTGSAYAAQIGTMRITEEVDALRTIGITPLEILALPKLLALVVAMPLLTVYADVMGMLGGMVVAQTMFGVGMADFIQRVPEAVAASSFWVGIVKAPVFAAIIVAVSCHHGFAVEGSTESVGRATTRSVVQSIFLVIVADAAFSIAFNLVDL